MAGQQDKKSQSELRPARSGRVHYKGLGMLALWALTTLSFAQNDAGRPSGQPQLGAAPSAARPPAVHSPGTQPHGMTPVPGSTTKPLMSPQPGLHPSSGPHGTTGYPPVQGALGNSPTPGQQVGSAPVPRQYGGGSPRVLGAHITPSTAQHATLVTRTPTGTRTEHQLSSGRRVLETTQATPGRGTVHAVRYGSAVTGVVERPIKAGYLSRTYVQGGHVLYARVYRQNTFQRFGHSFRYESLVPAVAFNTAYYAWAARPWSAPVRYHWRWEAEPWYPAYGDRFTPYSSYNSLDEWLTDYVIAQSLNNTYQTWQAENAPESGPVNSEAPATGPRPYWESPDAGQRPYWESPDDGRRPYWEESSSEDTRAQPKPSKAGHTASGSRTGSQGGRPPEASVPPLTADIKAELDAQIKQQLRERQTQESASDTDALPNSLKPGHTLFRVGTPLDVVADAPGRFCSLGANDYIERTGEMDENGTVPVRVKLSGASDCGTGLATRVSVNDLEAMDSEQQEALTKALLAASKNMGPNGLPQAPSTTPLLVAAGQTRPAPDATSTLSQLQ
jgi:hypothetical protein